VDCLEAIKLARSTGGELICGATAGAASAPELAANFGLSVKPEIYREVDAATARDILTGILHRDLAYGTRVISLAKAEELAGAFMERFDKPETRFFTNGEFKRDAGAGLVLAGWNPATTATFDTGILALSPTDSACVWVVDED
jgi:hypothetical protein